LDAEGGASFDFSRLDGPLPTRLVTAIELQATPELLPAECSLGVVTALQPKKRMWWGTIASPRDAHTRLVVHDLPGIYGGVDPNEPLHCALFSAGNHTPLKSTVAWVDAQNWSNGVELSAIWPDATAHLGDQAGYYTVFCEYGGLSVYSLMQNACGSVCLEHGF
jgi:hypothetical protein